MIDPTSEVELNALDRFSGGVAVFARLFARWMDQNGWSHPVMTSLAKASLGGAAWLHSSQIASLRRGTLRSPGPRTFVAIERLNFYLYRYQTEKLLIPGTSSSNHYSSPYVITENDQPPPLGWWVEVFCGVREPENLDYVKHLLFTDVKAADASIAFGKYFRHLLALSKIDVISDLPSVLKDCYPITDPHRRTKLQEVILATAAWSGEELGNELPNLVAMTSRFGGSRSEEELMRELS